MSELKDVWEGRGYTYTHMKTNQQHWMALNRASYCQLPLYPARNSVVFSLGLNKPSVLIERRTGLRVPNRGIRNRKGYDKVEVAAGLWNCWVEDDLSCVAGWWFWRISCQYESNIKCLALKAKTSLLIVCQTRQEFWEEVEIKSRVVLYRSALKSKRVNVYCVTSDHLFVL